MALGVDFPFSIGDSVVDIHGGGTQPNRYSLHTGNVPPKVKVM